MRHLGRRAAPLAAVIALWLGQPAPAAALLGWSGTVTPTSAVAGQVSVFTVTASNDNLLSILGVGSVGCVRVDVGPNFGIQSVTVLASPGAWLGSFSGAVATARAQDSGGRLGTGQAVAFAIAALPAAAGTSTWTIYAYREQDCGGSPLSGTETRSMQVAPAPLPPPTPAPTPAPTAVPTPAPTAVPTAPPASPPPAATRTPSPTPKATAIPTAQPATPKPTPTPAPLPPEPDATPQPNGAPRSTTTPQSAASTPGTAVGVAPSRAASPTPVASASPTPAAASAAPDANSTSGPPNRRDGSPPDAAPRSTLESIGAAAARLAVGESLSRGGGISLGPLGVIDGITVWAIPGAIVGGPGLLVILWVLTQAGVTLAWIPAVKRMRGRDDERPPTFGGPRRLAT
jgi:hypothetical protein